MSKIGRIISLCLVLALLCALCTGCANRAKGDGGVTTDAPSDNRNDAAPQVPVLPDDIRTNENGEPMLHVYVADEGDITQMNIEQYLCGVLAGEMKNDWPEEALKAQAILARTFVVRFITEKQSMYDGADISTDIKEAQAYDAAGVNERIKDAVEHTRGKVVCQDGEAIYAWFHAHSGGVTATAKEGLSYKHAAAYTQSVEGMEDDNAPQSAARWQAEFSEKEALAAAKEAGGGVGESIQSAAAGEKGESGRLLTLLINGAGVPANEFRVAIGSARMKSTLITDIAFSNGQLTISGKGYGHGVGMSQWGAYAMAEDGKKAEDIIAHYFKDVEIVQMWK